MSRKKLTVILGLWALMALQVHAVTELDILRERCRLQEDRIRELEQRLGISSPPPQVTKAAEISKNLHIVAPGDTLERIARRHACPLADLLACNDLKADAVIHPGQEIQLPSSVSKNETAGKNPAPPPGPSARYTIAKGDTFAAIARSHGITLHDLVAANPDVKPTALRPGQSIRLPDPKTLAASAEEPPSEPAAAPPTSLATVPPEPKTRIQPVKIEEEMTYQEFATRQGTTTIRLNQLNGLDLIDAARLAKGSELLAPTPLP